jgi:hypothetical protein
MSHQSRRGSQGGPGGVCQQCRLSRVGAEQSGQAQGQVLPSAWEWKLCKAGRCMLGSVWGAAQPGRRSLVQADYRTQVWFTSVCDPVQPLEVALTSTQCEQTQFSSVTTLLNALARRRFNATLRHDPHSEPLPPSCSAVRVARWIMPVILTRQLPCVSHCTRAPHCSQPYSPVGPTPASSIWLTAAGQHYHLCTTSSPLQPQLHKHHRRPTLGLACCAARQPEQQGRWLRASPILVVSWWEPATEARFRQP